MKLQTIKSMDGRDEYVLLPVAVYQALKHEIDGQLAKEGTEDEFAPFVLEDYIDNPVALARIRAGLTQKQLAEQLGVSQAYVSKIERQEKVTAALLDRVNEALLPLDPETENRRIR